ncbi:hypothetical protein BH24ACT26_BH24ACT26_02360 [soil metagenome]
MATLEAFCPLCRRTVHLGEGESHVCPVCSSRLMGPGLDEDRAKRIGDNEALVREVNERIEAFAASSIAFPAEEEVGFVCECGDPECSNTISLTLEEYEATRSHPARFAVLAGHEIPSAEVVVERHARYNVIEKVGSAHQDAIDDDPRA